MVDCVYRFSTFYSKGGTVRWRYMAQSDLCIEMVEDTRRKRRYFR